MAKCPNCNRKIGLLKDMAGSRGLLFMCNDCGVRLMPTFTSLMILPTIILSFLLFGLKFLYKLGLGESSFVILFIILTISLLFYLWWNLAKLQLVTEERLKLSKAITLFFKFLFIFGVFAFLLFLLVIFLSRR